MALKDTWVDRIDGVDDASAEDINEVAHAVIDLEENQPKEIVIDSEMSDTSENAVQNKVVKSYTDEQIDLLKADRKLKLLKTVTLEEDVKSINITFDKPIDEMVILFEGKFLIAESKAIAARERSDGPYLLYDTIAMKAEKRFYYAHCRYLAESLWETTLWDDLAIYNNGLSDAARTTKIAVSRSVYLKQLESLILFLPNSSEGNAFAAGSKIEIWGHESYEE